ncbi:MAG: hypothetical protein KGV51_01665 [Moraxellaceae bacterium]|nr:hypothetical protein [Moraxellaceae bacterium]
MLKINYNGIGKMLKNFLLTSIICFLMACSTSVNKNKANMNNPTFNLLVNQGNLFIEKDKQFIHFQCNQNNCLLTQTDTNDLIEILTEFAKEIWQNPNYIKEPYTEKIVKTDEQGYYWLIDNSKLHISYDNSLKLLKISCQNNCNIHLSINQTVEIIQILEQLNGR